jgi:hypothetical protein
MINIIPHECRCQKDLEEDSLISDHLIGVYKELCEEIHLAFETVLVPV